MSGSLDAENYICILENALVPTIYGYSSLSSWPVQLSDLNPVEHIWDYLAHVVQQQLTHNMSELWQCLKTAWNTVPQERTQTLVDSVITIVNNVIDARGGYTESI